MDKKDERGDTALHKAAMHGHYEIADMLIKKGAVVSEANNEGFTPFQHAVLYGRKVYFIVLLFFINLHGTRSVYNVVKSLSFVKNYLVTISIIIDIFPHFFFFQECAKLLLDAGTDVNAQFITNPGISLDYSINKATGGYLIIVDNLLCSKRII